MSKNQQHRICANCKHWKRHDVDYGEYPEDECGFCPKCGTTTYGDDDAFECVDFSATKRRKKR